MTIKTPLNQYKIISCISAINPHNLQSSKLHTLTIQTHNLKKMSVLGFLKLLSNEVPNKMSSYIKVPWYKVDT